MSEHRVEAGDYLGNTDTLYDAGNRFFHTSTSGVFTITDRPTRLMFVSLNTRSGDTTVSGIIYNGTTTEGEVVSALHTASSATLRRGQWAYDVVLSGGLTLEVFPGDAAPDLTIQYL